MNPLSAHTRPGTAQPAAVSIRDRARDRSQRQSVIASATQQFSDGHLPEVLARIHRHGLGASDEDLKLMAEKGTYFDPQDGLLIQTYLANKDRYLGTPPFNEDTFVGLAKALPLHHELMRRALRIPGGDPGTRSRRHGGRGNGPADTFLWATIWTRVGDGCWSMRPRPNA